MRQEIQVREQLTCHRGGQYPLPCTQFLRAPCSGVKCFDREEVREAKLYPYNQAPVRCSGRHDHNGIQLWSKAQGVAVRHRRDLRNRRDAGAWREVSLAPGGAVGCALQASAAERLLAVKEPLVPQRRWQGLPR